MPQHPAKTAHKPRKAPRQSRSSATVEAIIEAGARILETDGFEGYTTNAIARRAGVSIGSLYQYFPTKEAITAALIQQQSRALWQEISAIDVDIAGPDALPQLIKAAVNQQLRRPALGRLLDLEEQRLPRDPGAQPTGQQLYAIFRRCIVAAGFVDEADNTAIAQDLIAIIKGMVDAAGQRGERNPDDLTARVSRAVFGYLAHEGRG